MSEHAKDFGPEVPNYALLNEARKGKSAPTAELGRKLAGKIKRKLRKSPRRDQQSPN